jgi:Putative peptidoglycan binding domain
MKPSLLICIGCLTVALTAGAQMPDNRQHKKGAQRTTIHPAYRGPSAVRHTAPQHRTFSGTRVRQSSVSTARSRERTFRTTRVQPSTNSSFMRRSTTPNHVARRQTHPTSTDDRTRSKFSPRPRSAFVNRPTMTNAVARKQTRVASANDWRGSRLSERPSTSSASLKRFATRQDVAGRQTRWDPENRRADSRFRERPRPNSSLLKPFTANDIGARQKTRAEFSNKWTNSNLTRQVRSSFVDRSIVTSTAIREQRRAAFSNNWRGDWFAGRQYWAFRNYRREWHDRGWWHHHCDQIVFVTVYSQPFPFYFNAGYWYPAWGYYADAYYPYDGPIYCYNDLPPDEIVTNVQEQLYDEGYYDGPIDGILGPDTRAAIADYQADHGLAVTAAIDEPTVESLGLV